MSVKVKQRNGKWWVYISYKGKRKAKSIGDSKKAAEEVARKISAQLALGELGILTEKPRQPFDAYCQKWLDTYVKTYCKQSTADNYQGVARTILIPTFGSIDLSAITREHVKALVYAQFAKGLKTNTVASILTPLRAMFTTALEDGLVQQNPCLGVLRRIPREKQTGARKADALSREELRHLLMICEEHFPRIYPLVLTLGRTGLRIGEALGLRWSDIDFYSHSLEVRQQLHKGRISTPKNGKTRRVDLSDQLAATLQALLTDRKRETLARGWKELPETVFLSPDGQPWNLCSLRARSWWPLLMKAGLRRIRLHDMRHTFASLLIQQGESLAYVKEQLGHHSIKLTVDTYGHLIPGANRDAVNRLDDATIYNPPATGRLQTKKG